MLNGQCGEMGIRNEIRHCLSPMEQIPQDCSMTIGRQGNPHRWKGKPFLYLLPGVSDAEGAINGFGIRPDPDKCQKGWPRQSNSLPTIQLIF